MKFQDIDLCVLSRKSGEDIVEIMNYGVMSTPALVVDGKVKSSGKTLTSNEIIELLKGTSKNTF